MKRIFIGLAAVVAFGVAIFFLTGGTPENRMRTALIGAGLDEPTAECLAGELAENLSYRQMWSLRSLSIFGDHPPAELSVADFVRATRGRRDREIWMIAGRAGATCALRNGRLGPLSIRR